MLRARILGTGSYVPGHVLTNHDLEKMVDTSDAWISERTGIRERRVSANDSTADMAEKAGRAALKASGISPKDIDLVVVGTVTPDMVFPATACYVQMHLGIRSGTPAFDVSAACSGFVYAVDVADKYIRSGAAKNALVVGVDAFSRILDWKDRSTCVLFGDGAGAVVIAAEKGRHGILSSHIHSDGREWGRLYVPGAIQPSPFEKDRPRSVPHLKMQGNETFKFAVRTMERVIKEALEHNGLKAGDISLLIPHQANKRIIDATKERLGLPPERVFVNLERYGNTSAASIPIALDEAVREGRIRSGDIVVFVAFGGGLTWGASVVRW